MGPLKRFHVPVHEIAMMMTIALRFIPTLIEETDKIMNAQKARGADLESGGLVQRAKALIPILIPLLPRQCGTNPPQAAGIQQSRLRCAGIHAAVSGHSHCHQLHFPQNDIVLSAPQGLHRFWGAFRFCGTDRNWSNFRKKSRG